METTNHSFQALINAKKPVLIDFFATWCGPCRMLEAILTEVKATLKDRIAVIKIDVDKNKAIAAHYRVKGVPTMMLFQNGKQLWRQSGVCSKIEIVQIIMDKSTWPKLPGQEQ